MSNFRRFAAGASVLAFILPAIVYAEERQPFDDVVVIAAHLTNQARVEVQKRPGGVDIVDAEEFADAVAVSLRDALALSPGVYSQPRFGQEVRLSIRGSGISRGFHMRGLTLLQDGVPINLADDNGDFQELDPQLFERIEVYRGGNALRYGGSTLGGAINAVTPTGRTAPRFELRVDGGSFDTIRAKAAAAYADPRGDAYVALTTDNSDGDRQHAWRKAVRFNGNVGLRLSDGVETRFYATVSDIDQRLPGSLTLNEALSTPKLSRQNNIDGDQQRNIRSIRLQNRTTVDLGTGRLAFGAFYNAKQLFHPIFQLIDQKSDDRGVFARVDLGGTAGALPWELTLGTQARFGKVAAKQFVNLGGRRGALMADVDQTAHTINSYGEVRVKPVAPLTIVAGAIYSTGKRTGDNRLLPERGGSRSFDGLAPKIGLLFEPAEAVQVYANYSRSIELPGFGELFQTVKGLPTLIPVRTQKAWTAEVGTRGTLGIASWDIGVYRADLRDEMLQFNSGDGTNIPAATFNADRTRHQGIEASLDLRLAPWARLRQTYMYSDFRFRDDAQFGDNRLPVVPKQLYRASLRLGGEALNMTPTVEWLPQGAWADYANTVRAPGYTLLGVGAEARVREGITAFVDARNLTGKKAIGDISAVVAAGAASVAFYPVERRAFYGGVRAAF